MFVQQDSADSDCGAGFMLQVLADSGVFFSFSRFLCISLVQAVCAISICEVSV